MSTALRINSVHGDGDPWALLPVLLVARLPAHTAPASEKYLPTSHRGAVGASCRTLARTPDFQPHTMTGRQPSWHIYASCLKLPILAKPHVMIYVGQETHCRLLYRHCYGTKVPVCMAPVDCTRLVTSGHSSRNVYTWLQNAIILFRFPILNTLPRLRLLVVLRINASVPSRVLAVATLKVHAQAHRVLHRKGQHIIQT